MGGKTKDEYKGVAKFFTFLSQPEMQADWHQATGYVPITMAAYELTKKLGLLRQESGHRRRGQADDQQDDRQVARHAPRQLRADPRRDRRGTGKRLERQEDAKKALDEAVTRGNEQIERFAKTAKE